MQCLNLAKDEKSVLWDDNPFQTSTTRSEKNEDLTDRLKMDRILNCRMPIQLKSVNQFSHYSHFEKKWKWHVMSMWTKHNMTGILFLKYTVFQKSLGLPYNQPTNDNIILTVVVQFQ